jgi:hypothetical protein
MGKNSKGEQFDSNIPGPGAYHFNLRKNKGLSFTKDTRDKNLKNYTPGPGESDLKLFFADVPKYLLPDKQ